MFLLALCWVQLDPFGQVLCIAEGRRLQFDRRDFTQNLHLNQFASPFEEALGRGCGFSPAQAAQRVWFQALRSVHCGQDQPCGGGEDIATAAEPLIF